MCCILVKFRAAAEVVLSKDSRLRRVMIIEEEARSKLRRTPLYAGGGQSRALKLLLGGLLKLPFEIKSASLEVEMR